MNLDSNTSPDPDRMPEPGQDRMPEPGQDRKTAPLAGSPAEAVAAASGARSFRGHGNDAGVGDTGTGARLLISEGAPSAAERQSGKALDGQLGAGTAEDRRCSEADAHGSTTSRQDQAAADGTSEQLSPGPVDAADVESEMAAEQEKPSGVGLWRLRRRRPALSLRRRSSTDTQRARLPVAFAVLTAVALIGSLAAAAWFGAGWIRAAYFTDGPRAAARDEALGSAQQAAINMTSMDIGDVPGSLARARSSMTGAILQSATEHKQQAESMATEAGVRMQSEVLGASVTSLSSERDRAAVLVVLRVNETEPNQPDQPGNAYRYTWTLDMVDDSGTWKAEQIASLGQPVPLNGAGNGGNAPTSGAGGGPTAPDAPPAGPGRAQPPADTAAPEPPGASNAPAAAREQPSVDAPASYGTVRPVPRSGDQEV